MFREGTKAAHGNLVGNDKFCHQLKKALGEAVQKIPNPHISSAVISQFIKVTYGEVQWPSKPKADLKATEVGKASLTGTVSLREERGRQRVGKKGGKRRSDRSSPPLQAREGNDSEERTV